MKKAQAKIKLTIATPTQKGPHAEPSPVCHSAKSENRNNRYYVARTTLQAKHSPTQPIPYQYKLSGSKTPSTKSHLLFPKSKPSDHTPDELTFHDLQTKTDPSPPRHEDPFLSSFLTIPKNTSQEPKKPLTHQKSNSLTRPLTIDSLSKRPTHTPKTNSTSSIDTLSSPKRLTLDKYSTLPADYDLLASQQSLSKGEGCVNHPYKKGKYYVLVGSDGSGSGSKYCSKCAIKLAGTGVKV